MKWYVWLAFDAVFLGLMLVLIGPPLAAVGYLVSRLPLPTWALFALAPAFGVLFLTLFIATAGVVRLALPRLRPGTYPFPGHAQATAWMAHFAVMRIMNFQLWSGIMLCFASLRWLLLRALGARVAFGIQTSSDVSITDPSLVEVGAGCMLAAGTFLAGHLVENGQLLLSPVVLAPGVQLMGEVSLTPGTRIGADTVVGPGTKVLPQTTIGDDVYIGMGCTLYNGVRIGSNAVIGHHVVLESDVAVGEGAVVAAGARVPKGTVIPAGDKYPPRAQAPAALGGEPSGA